MKYQVRAIKMPQGNWVAEYIEPNKTSNLGGMLLMANPVRLSGSFTTENEAIAFGIEFIKNNEGANETEIEIRKSKSI